MKVLVNVPSLEIPGGVASHYRGLLRYWTENVEYNVVGGRSKAPNLLVLVYDYLKFILNCIFENFDVLLVNPSLAKTAIIRDALFLLIAKAFGIKVVVFFHGWDSNIEEKISAKPTLFRKVYGEADSFIVLSNEFAEKLRKWGVESPIYLSTTKVDNKLVEDFDAEEKEYGQTILFLARVEKNKGVFVALDAFSRVLKKFPDANFIVAGSGGALGAAKEFVRKRSIPNVKFLGNVTGEKLINTLRDSDLYILPTTHGEGMPTSVLEAMAFGLPVVTRPVGGLKDFFENGEMGFLSDRVDSEWFADAISKLLSKEALLRRIGKYNHNYAKSHFLASEVALQIEEILRA